MAERQQNLLQYLWSTRWGFSLIHKREMHSTEVKESDLNKLQRWGIFQATY